jgi:cyclic pyranopterin phosphate synthase
LHRLTVSLDTLRADRFLELTRRGLLDRVLDGIAAAARSGLQPLKIDTVVMRDVNDDELVDMIEYGKTVSGEVRFIEYMDVGGATHWSVERVVTRSEIVQRLARHYGAVEEVDEQSSAPADRFRLPDGTLFGIISSTTAPFCQSCDRARLTADGMWYFCLYARLGTDLRKLVRSGASRREVVERITAGWGGRRDRGAEERLASRKRSALLSADELRNDPHLEMHTRGG